MAVANVVGDTTSEGPLLDAVNIVPFCEMPGPPDGNPGLPLATTDMLADDEIPVASVADGRGLPGRDVGTLSADCEPLAREETAVLGSVEIEAPEFEPPLPRPLDIGIPEVRLCVETPAGAEVTDAVEVPARELPPVAGVPEFDATREPESTLLVTAVEDEVTEPESTGASEAVELDDPDCKALRKDGSVDVAVPDLEASPAVAESVRTRVETVLEVGDPEVGTPKPVESSGPLEEPEPGAPMVLTRVWTDVATEVVVPGIGAAPDEGFAGDETGARLENPAPEFEGLPVLGTAVETTVRMEVTFKSGGILDAEEPEPGLLGLPAVADVAGAFPRPDLSLPIDVTTVTKEGRAELGRADPDGPADGGEGITAPDVPGPPAFGPARVETVVEPGVAGALEELVSCAPMLVVVGTDEGVPAVGVLENPEETIGWLANGGSAMMVMTEGIGPSMVVTIVIGGGGAVPDAADSGVSAVAMTVITEGTGPLMVVTIVIGGNGPEGGAPGAEDPAEDELGALGSGTPALEVTVIGGEATVAVVRPLEFDGATRDDGRPVLAGVEPESSVVDVMPAEGVGVPEVALAGSLGDEARGVVVSSGVELGSVELADVLGRAVLELLKTVLLELVDDDEEVSFDSLQTPGDETPNRHLHDVEQGLPGVPLASFPLSHSSPNDASILLSPQPTGIAPRAMMYGIPADPSAYDSSPSPVALRAMAKASNPSVPGSNPLLGNSVNTSWTLQDQLPMLLSPRLLSSGAPATR